MFPRGIPAPGPCDCLGGRIALGPDGNMWFTVPEGGWVGHVSPDGDYTIVTITPGRGQPEDIAAGPDGAMWFTDTTGHIGRISMDGAVTMYGGGRLAPSEIAAGPDGTSGSPSPAGAGSGRDHARGRHHGVPHRQGRAARHHRGPRRQPLVLVAGGRLDRAHGADGHPAPLPHRRRPRRRLLRHRRRARRQPLVNRRRPGAHRPHHAPGRDPPLPGRGGDDRRPPDRPARRARAGALPRRVGAHLPRRPPPRVSARRGARHHFVLAPGEAADIDLPLSAPWRARLAAAGASGSSSPSPRSCCHTTSSRRGRGGASPYARLSASAGRARRSS